MPFDVVAAERDGVPTAEILQHLLSTAPGFNYSQAQKDGLSDEEIIQHLSGGGGVGAASTPPAPSAPPTPSTWRYPAMALNSVNKGLFTALGIPGDLEQLGTSLIANPLSRLTGIGHPEDLSKAQTADNTATLFPTSGQLLDLAGKNSLINPEALQPGAGPYPRLEHQLDIIGQGLGSALPMIPMAPLRAGANIAASVAGNEAAAAAHDVAPGTELPTAAVAGLGLQGLHSALSSRSLAGLARGLGSSETLQQAGEHLQSSIQQYVDRDFPAAEAAVHDPVRAALHTPDAPKGPPTPMPAFTKAAQEIAGSGGELDAVSDLLGRSGVKALADKLSAIQMQSPVDVRRGLVPPAGPPAWDDVRAVRTKLGKAMIDQKSQLQSLGQDNLDKLYAGLTEDLATSATAHGAGDLFATANATSTALREQLDKTLSPVVAPGVRPEQAANRLLTLARKGGSDLSVLRSVVPDATNELAAAHLLQSPQGWAKLAPEAQIALVPDEATRGRIDRAVDNAAGKPIDKLHSLLAEGLSGETGSQTARAAHALFPNVSPDVLEAAGWGLGMAIPPAYRGAKTLLTQPRLLRAPLAAMVGGANELFPAGPQP